MVVWGGKLEFLERLLARSKGLPFQLRIALDLDMADCIQDIGRMLQRHFHRCRSLHLLVEDDSISRVVFPLPWTLSGLQDLSVENPFTLKDADEVEYPGVKRLVWGQHVELRTLVLNDCLISPSTIGMFQDIECLDLRAGSIDGLPYLVKDDLFGSLLDLKVLCWIMEDEVAFPEDPLYLESLEYLFIAGDYVDLTSVMFTPQLKVLHLSARFCEDPEAIESIRKVELSWETAVGWEELSLTFIGAPPSHISLYSGVTHLTYQHMHSLSSCVAFLDSLVNEADVGPSRTLRELNLHIFELLLVDGPRPRPIDPARLLEFFKALGNFIKKRSANHPFLDIYLDFRVEYFPVLQVIDDVGPSDSVAIHFERHGSKLYRTDDKLATAFRRKWNPVWWE